MLVIFSLHFIDKKPMMCYSVLFPKRWDFLLGTHTMIKTLSKFIRPRFEGAVLMVLLFEFLFPHYALAVTPAEVRSVAAPESLFLAPIGQPDPVVVATYTIPVTSYSSTADQTDSTPCITANGFDLCANNRENVIAANFLKFGTKVRMPELFGNRVFTVQDRMNARYYYRADVWMIERQDAVKFGIHYTKIEVLE